MYVTIQYLIIHIYINFFHNSTILHNIYIYHIYPFHLCKDLHSSLISTFQNNLHANSIILLIYIIMHTDKIRLHNCKKRHFTPYISFSPLQGLTSISPVLDVSPITIPSYTYNHIISLCNHIGKKKIK